MSKFFTNYLACSKGKVLMKYSYTAKKRIRKSFGKLGDVLPIPNLIELQVLSYNKFLCKNNNGIIDFSNSGLDEVFK